MRVIQWRFHEGCPTWIEHKKDYCECEQVDGLRLILDPHLNLRCHVLIWTDMVTAVTPSICPTDWTSKPEIANFEIVMAIKQDVLALQVPVSHPGCMHEAKSVKKLLWVVATDFGWKTTFVRKIVEKFALCVQLACDIANLCLLPIGVLKGGLLFGTVHFHHILVLYASSLADLVPY